ncbi:hypothetical protein [Oceanobacillus alkalisoli]|nr:hypothetical protein [Oceanobacillus alkalisoli]
MCAPETIKTLSEEERNQIKSLLMNYSKEELALALYQLNQCKEMK